MVGSEFVKLIAVLIFKDQLTVVDIRNNCWVDFNRTRGIELQTAAKFDRNQAGGNFKTFVAVNVSGNRDGATDGLCIDAVAADNGDRSRGATAPVTTAAGDFNPGITVVDEEGVAT